MGMSQVGMQLSKCTIAKGVRFVGQLIAIYCAIILNLAGNVAKYAHRYMRD
jgi:hypothetical protein